MEKRITSLRSSCVSVGDSPVVPTAIIPSMPAAICDSINFCSAVKSIAPSRKGVTRAVKVPRNIQNRWSYGVMEKWSDEIMLRGTNSRLQHSKTPFLDFNRAFEDKLGRSGKRDIGESLTIAA